jgi:hypothetical protein
VAEALLDSSLGSRVMLVSWLVSLIRYRVPLRDEDSLRADSFNSESKMSPLIQVLKRGVTEP